MRADTKGFRQRTQGCWRWGCGFLPLKVLKNPRTEPSFIHNSISEFLKWFSSFPSSDSSYTQKTGIEWLINKALWCMLAQSCITFIKKKKKGEGKKREKKSRILCSLWLLKWKFLSPLNKEWLHRMNVQQYFVPPEYNLSLNFCHVLLL